MRGYVDLQINGCWGVDFNADALTQESWLFACEKLYASGTSTFLPTIITDHVDRLTSKLERLAGFCQSTPPETAQPIGIHLEGPFLSPDVGFIGAHPKQHACVASLDTIKRLIDASQGWIKMVTLAPEMDRGAQVTRFLSQQGILVAAGHTDASRDELCRALDQGLKCFTHFGNGCPSILPRHDNILHRVMSLRERIHVTLIADGFHLPVWLLEMAISWFGVDRSIIVSDAISAAGLPSGYHTLGDRRVWVDEDGVPRSEDRSHFVGSGATLDRMYSIIASLSRFNSIDIDKLFFKNAQALMKFA